MVISSRNSKLLFLLNVVLIWSIGFDAEAQPALKFIENKNQWPAEVHYSAKVPGGTMTVGPGGFSYYLLDNKKIRELHDASHSAPDSEADVDQMIRGHFVQTSFIGSNAASPVAFGKSTEYYNYYRGSKPGKWATRAYAFEGMLYDSFYEGIDLKVYSSGENLKYDYIVTPYADPSRILVRYQGAESMVLDNGNLVLETSLGEIIEKRPLAYQYIAGSKILVECEYFLQGNLLSFCFPRGYDPCYELVIDPLLIFSTYSGSTADNWGSTATPGEGGTLYSAGVTEQFSGGLYPATPGVFQTSYGGIYDIGILKYDSTGSQLLYASYLGGSNSESPHSLVVNSSEELIVLGTTSSNGAGTPFPTTPGAHDRTFNGGTGVGHTISYSNGSDIVVSRISKDGTQLLASTYLGGSLNDGLNPDGPSSLVKNYGDQLRGDIITDSLGNIYISSVTSSMDFPMLNSVDDTYNMGASDAILIKLSPALQILWSTYLGGSGTDASHTLKLDIELNIYAAGGTTSPNFPVTNGSHQILRQGVADGWIARISADGSTILNSTLTGSTAFDQVYFLDIDENNEPYVYGVTDNGLGNFPITPATVYQNPRSGQFLQKFDSALTTLKVSTVFGSGRGSPDLSPTAFLVNDCNNIYLAGWGGGSLNSRVSNGFETSTSGLRTSEDAIQKSTSGHDFYFIVLTDNAGEFLYGTFLGGSQSLTHVDGGTSRFDKHGIVYHAVCSGCNTDGLGAKSDFPTTPNTWSNTNNSKNCNNAAFKFDLSSLKAGIQTNSEELNSPGLSVICMPDKIVFENVSVGGEIYKWNLGDGTKVTEIDPISIIHDYKEEGLYTVTLTILDQGTCREIDSTKVTILVNKSMSKIQEGDEMCSGDSYQLSATGGISYEWKTLQGELLSNASDPIVQPADTTEYLITILEANGCVRQDTVQINVIPSILPEFKYDRNANCSARPVIVVENLTDSLWSGDQTFIDFGDGATSDLPEESHAYENDGLYTIRAVVVREFCTFEKTEIVPVFTTSFPNIITPGGSEGFNDIFTIQFGEVAGVTPADHGFKVSLVIYNRWGNVLYETDDYQNDWSGEGLAAGLYYYEVTVEGHTTCKSWLQVVK